MEQAIDSVFFGRHEADPRALLYFEWRQRAESGYAVATFEPEVRALAIADPADLPACWAVLDRLESAPRVTGWPYYEPDLPDTAPPAHGSSPRAVTAAQADSSMRGIEPPEMRSARSACSLPAVASVSGADSGPLPGPTPAADLGPSAAPVRSGSAASERGDDLLDRIHGGWLGRCVGCTLGKPLENGFVWTPARIRAYLERAGNYPLVDYVPALLPPLSDYPLNPTWPASVRGRIAGAPRDDDVDYTVLGLHLLETCGTNFTAADVAAAWLEHLPFLQTYTAERVAYRNLVDGLQPHVTARYRNPYREWIGALIRADIYGYVSPGDPARAAALAARDASLSHTTNGVYAAMWAAALIAAAGTEASPAAALTAAHELVPPNSRLAVALADVLAAHERGIPWEQAVDAIHRNHGHYNWVHAIPNACLVAAGLLWGAGDFTRTIALTVQGGCDTDSNGATAGSVAGIFVGATNIPAHWTDPLQDRLHSAVAGYDGSRISDLARRTRALAARGR